MSEKDIILEGVSLDTDHLLYRFSTRNGGSNSLKEFLENTVESVYNGRILSPSVIKNNGSVKYISRFSGSFEVDINKKPRNNGLELILDAADENEGRLQKLHEKIMSNDNSFTYDNIVKKDLKLYENGYFI